MMTTQGMTSATSARMLTLILLACATPRSLAARERDDYATNSDLVDAYDSDEPNIDDDSLYKRAPAYGFGLGKRASMYSFGLGKRASTYGFGLGKRAQAYGFGLGKRAPAYGFGLGKRQAYGFGLGKRSSWSKWFDGPSRDVLKRPSYGFGLGKRSVDQLADHIATDQIRGTGAPVSMQQQQQEERDQPSEQQLLAALQQQARALATDKRLRTEAAGRGARSRPLSDTAYAQQL